LAFIALDGGIGSVQEILIIAELLAAKHPVVHYKNKEGNKTPKPLYILNCQDIYSELINYLKNSKYSYLLKHIRIKSSLRSIFSGLDRCFLAYPPVIESPDARCNFRNDYFTVVAPP
jgi:hypothetical protein